MTMDDPMEVRITWRSEVYIKGDNLAEIKEKWEELNLMPIIGNDDVVGFDFVELVSVEDADTYEDMMGDFENAEASDADGEDNIIND